MAVNPPVGKDGLRFFHMTVQSEPPRPEAATPLVQASTWRRNSLQEDILADIKRPYEMMGEGLEP